MEFSKGSEKSIVGLLTVAIAFIMFLVFYKNQDFLMESSNAVSFVFIWGVGLTLALILFFLVSNRIDSHSAHSKKKK